MLGIFHSIAWSVHMQGLSFYSDCSFVINMYPFPPLPLWRWGCAPFLCQQCGPVLCIHLHHQKCGHAGCIPICGLHCEHAKDIPLHHQCWKCSVMALATHSCAWTLWHWLRYAGCQNSNACSIRLDANAQKNLAWSQKRQHHGYINDILIHQYT